MSRRLRTVTVWLGSACLLGSTLALEIDAREVSTTVGPVTAVVRLEPDEAVIGDPMTLIIEATAEESVEVLMPEFGEALERFAIVDFVPRERLDDEGRTVFSQRYTLQAPRSGEHVLPAILIEFVDHRPGSRPAPEGHDAYELLSEPLPFEVASVVPDTSAAELSPPMAKLGPLGVRGTSPFLYMGVAALLLLALSPFAWRAFVRWRAMADAKSAFELASSELEALLAGPRPRPEQPEKLDAFFVELSGIVRRYVERRFALRSPELTTEHFLDLVSASPGLVQAHQDLLRDLLRQSDLVKFAHHIPTPDAIEHSIDLTRRFLAETREEITAPTPEAVAVGAR